MSTKQSGVGSSVSLHQPRLLRMKFLSIFIFIGIFQCASASLRIKGDQVLDSSYDSTRRQLKASKGAPKTNTNTNTASVVVIGGGIAGHTAMWEMAQRGIGADKGIMLIEKNPNDFHVCGIIEPIEFEESTGLGASPFSPTYMPYRITTHALRINIATQSTMRCLANELKIPLYFSPWNTDFRLNGYLARSSGFEVSPTAVLPNAQNNRQACTDGYRNDFYEKDPACKINTGSADLVTQTSSTGIASVNLWNYQPSINYNQGDFDPVDEWYGWALGYSNYYNPTANYDGKGSTYNNASPYPFQPNNPAQDHPRHQCSRVKDLYSLYQYYLGPDYAKFVCDTNFGFLGDCYSGADACSYIGSSTEEGYSFNSNLQYDEGYPVGSMTELCTRQKYLVQHNTKGVPTTYVKGEAVVSVDYNTDAKTMGFGKYVVSTAAGRHVYTDAVIISAEPSAVAKMSGSVIQKITSQPQFQVTNPVTVVTIALHWKSGSPGWNWMDAISKTLFGSYRMLNPGSCVNRIEILNQPYARNGAMRSVRVTYTDFTCIRNLVGLAAIDDPQGKLTVKTGFPVDGALATEQLRELKELFMGGGPYSIYNISDIPKPDFVAYNLEPNSWFYFKSGAQYKIKEISDWASQPLLGGGKGEKVALAHQAWQILYSGWSQSSVNSTREALLKLFPQQITRADLDAKAACNDKWPKEDYHVQYKVPCDVTKLLSEQQCDPSYSYSAPGVEKQWDYTDGLPNEHFPPYSWDEPIQWQGP